MPETPETTETTTERPYVLQGVLLLALAFVGWLCVLSYDPADAPATLVFPPNAQPTNWLFAPGAWFASILFNAFGYGVYFLLPFATLAALSMIRAKQLTQFNTRIIGAIMTLSGACAFSMLVAPLSSPGPLIGPGGYLGATILGLLTVHFQAMGIYLIVGTLMLAGLVLSAEDALHRAFSWVFPKIASRMRHLLSIARDEARGSKASTRRETDLDDAEEYLTDEDEPAEGVEEEEWEEVDEDEYEEEWEEEEDEEPEEAIRVVRPTRAESPAASAEPAAPAEEAPIEYDLEQDETKKAKKKPEKNKKGEEPPAAEPEEETLKVVPPKKKVNEERERVKEELNAAAGQAEEGDYELPSLELLMPSEEFEFDEHEKGVRRQAKILEKTFTDFGFNVKVVEIQTGPVISQFEVQLERGLRLSKILGLSDDLAIALKVPSVRIVAPIPGKNTVGIEVPNPKRQLVRLREVMEETMEKADESRIPIFLGKDVSGNPMIVDLASMPHLLIAGRTGTGKSVCLNSLIVSILMTRRPDEVRMLLIDPKMVELSPYKTIPHLMHPVVTHMPKAEAILAWAVEKMEERYSLLARAGVRHLSVYNQLGEEELRRRMQPESDEEWEQVPQQMPYIVIVADEMADLMMTAAKEVETHIIRLAQKSRAVGIHLVLATQKPTVDIITGLIKSNLPARICFEVASRTDSRVVLDEMGGEKLLGHGDLLMLRPGTSVPIRGQGTYVSDEEITEVIEAVATSEQHFVKELVQLQAAAPDSAGGVDPKNRDAIYDAAVDVVIREGRGSVSLLQRSLGVGYGRAARMIDHMAEDGVVGTYNGSQAREVLMTLDDWRVATGMAPEIASEEDVADPPAPKKASTIQLRSPRDIEVTDAELYESDEEEASAMEEESPEEAEDAAEEGWYEADADEEDDSEEAWDEEEEEGEEDVWDEADESEEDDGDWEYEYDYDESDEEEEEAAPNDEAPFKTNAESA